MVRFPTGKLSAWKGHGIIAVAFLISRTYAELAGVTFYGSFIHRLWQAHDVQLLADDLARTIWYSHSQPPLFNLLVGVLVKLFPLHYAVLFHWLNAGLSLATALMLYSVLRQFQLNSRVIYIVVLAFVLSPAIILYENLFTYTILTIFLVMATVFFLTKFIYSRSMAMWFGFCLTLAVLVLTRSSFHLLFMLVLLALITITMRRLVHWRRMLLVSVLPLVVASGWYFKNLVLFNRFTSSSWLGMNLARVLPPDGPLPLLPFRPLEEYEPNIDLPGRNTGIPVLDQRRKSSGFVNYNHIGYLVVSDHFKSRAVDQIMQSPANYFASVSRGLIIYFSPATHAPFVEGNVKRIRHYAAALTPDFSGFTKYQIQNIRGLHDPRGEFMRRNAFTFESTLPVLFVYVFSLGFIIYRWSKSMSSSQQIIIVACICFQAYGMLVGSFFEFGENNRFRLEISPAVYVPFAVALHCALSLLQRLKPSFKILK